MNILENKFMQSKKTLTFYITFFDIWNAYKCAFYKKRFNFFSYFEWYLSSKNEPADRMRKKLNLNLFSRTFSIALPAFWMLWARNKKNFLFSKNFFSYAKM